jgi:hypothetical protein
LYPHILYFLQPALVKAVFEGNYEEVENLLLKSMAANISDSEKRTPLHAASFRGFAEIAGMPFCHFNVHRFYDFEPSV